MELDSIYGLQNKYIVPNDINKNINNNTISFIEVLKSIYLNKIDCIAQSDLDDTSLNSLIITQEELIDNGFKINKGIKIINLSEMCAICHENKKNGILLNCRHTFCVDCIKTYLISNMEEKKCPLCRSELNIVFD